MTKYKIPVSRIKMSDTKRCGFVYLIESEYGYKIGRTKNVRSRTQLFGVKLPFPIRLVHIIETTDYVALERDMHHYFKDKRLEGEWFDLTAPEVQAIKRWNCTDTINDLQ